MLSYHILRYEINTTYNENHNLSLASLVGKYDDWVVIASFLGRAVVTFTVAVTVTVAITVTIIVIAIVIVDIPV